jgi:hypothetical protein
MRALGCALLGANRKRTANFALKSQLPSVYTNREGADAGGLMSYGADQADIYRRVAYYADRILKGGQACRSAGAATDEVRVCGQFENCEADRRYNSPRRASAGDQNHSLGVSNTT